MYKSKQNERANYPKIPSASIEICDETLFDCMELGLEVPIQNPLLVALHTKPNTVQPSTAFS